MPSRYPNKKKSFNIVATGITLSAFAAVLVLTLSCFEALDRDDSAQHQTTSTPLIDGTDETGFPGAGALVMETEEWWGGNFCSATLIAEQWVLTAAHCIRRPVEEGEGTGGSTADLQPWMVSFFIGEDATYEGSGEDGVLFDVDSFHVHGEYDEETLYHDIALAHLRDPVPSTDATPYALNQEAITVGTEVFWVGYGQSIAADSSSSGIKRSGWGTVTAVDLLVYSHVPSPAQPCFGDSGGPAFVTVSDDTFVAGVVSAANASVEEDCTGGGVDTRVDAHIVWIQDTMAGGGGGLSCDLIAGECGSQACWYVTDDETACLPSYDGEVGDSCNADPLTWNEALPCADGLFCFQTGETEADGECTAWCEDASGCVEGEFCRYFFTDMPYGICYDSCSLLGGDCPATQACWPVDDGSACYASDGIAVGQTCDPQGEITSLQCADGAVCVRIAEDNPHVGRCMAYCFEDTDCVQTDQCVQPETWTDDVGVCQCRDADDDDVCQIDDCDDTDPDIRPGTEDVCFDDIDNNCDGEIDEECGECEDVDADLSCPPDDCDDNSSAIHPGITEICDDGIDNDCNGTTDGADPACVTSGGGDEDDGGCSTVGDHRNPGGWLIVVAALLMVMLCRRSPVFE